MSDDHYTISRSARFERELAELVEEDQLNQALKGVLWILRRAPGRGIKAHASDYWAVTTGGPGWKVRRVVIFYFFDVETRQVGLDSIRATTDEE